MGLDTIAQDICERASRDKVSTQIHIQIKYAKPHIRQKLYK